jgi:ArsR family transcriptional regulator, nickel/cobalt-responsive transcriptional repressor
MNERVAERVADAMFALASPSRIQILACLRDDPHSVGEIVDTVKLEQSAVSHQLRVLRDQGLVRVERVGRQRVYALQDEFVAALLDDAVSHVERRDRQRIRLFGRGSSGRRTGT